MTATVAGEAATRPPSRPLFSVIVPAFDAAVYLGECLASVAGQTCRDFELVVVDDGSRDATPDVIERFAREQGNCALTLVRQQNQGPLLARRAGLERARGTYAVFLDADDALRPDALEILAREIGASHVDVVVFGMSTEPDYSSPRYCEDLPFGLHEGQGYDLARRATLRGRMNNMWGKAIARAAFDLGADYSSFRGLAHGEDLFQLLPAIDRARSCSHVAQALYFYRRHAGASTASYEPGQLDDMTTVAGRLVEYGTRWGMPRDAAYGALRNFCATAKILALDPGARDIRNEELDRMAVMLRKTGLEAHVADQRPDNRAFLRAVLAGRPREAFAVLRAVEGLKALRGQAS